MHDEADDPREHEADREIDRQRAGDRLDGDAPLARSSRTTSPTISTGTAAVTSASRAAVTSLERLPLATPPISTLITTPTTSARR
jgi:hypothetical protein